MLGTFFTALLAHLLLAFPTGELTHADRQSDRDRVLRGRGDRPDARVRVRRRRPRRTGLRRSVSGQRAVDCAAPGARERDRARVRAQPPGAGAARPRPPRPALAQRLAGAAARARAGLRDCGAADRNSARAEPGRVGLRTRRRRGQLGNARRAPPRAPLVPVRARCARDSERRLGDSSQSCRRSARPRTSRTCCDARYATRRSSSATSRRRARVRRRLGRPLAAPTGGRRPHRDSRRRRADRVHDASLGTSPSSTRCSTPRGSRSSVDCRFARSPRASAAQARCSRRSRTACTESQRTARSSSSGSARPLGFRSTRTTSSG